MNPSPDELTVRAAEPDDADAVRRIYSAPGVVHGTLQVPYSSPHLWRERLENPDEDRRHLVATAGDEVVGHLSLVEYLKRPRRRHAGTFGMAVIDEWQGRGVGATLMRAMLDLADNWLGLRRIELEVFVDNEPAIRLYERFGFVREGTLRQYALRAGEFVDVHVMARIRPDKNVD